MKDKIAGFIAFLIMVVLIIGLLFFGWILYTVIFDTNTSQTVQTSDTQTASTDGTEVINKVEKKSIAETITDIFTTPVQESITYSEEKSNGKYFYEQLNENQKAIYNGFQDNKDKLMSGTYAIQFGNKFADTLSTETGSKVLGDDYQSAIEAFTHDNSDLFYLDVSKMYLNIETKKKAFSTTYNVYIKPEEGSTYFAKGFTSETDVKIAMQKIEQEANRVKAKFTGDAYKDIKLIHDYLIEEIDYDENYQSKGTYSIYGAFVDKKCVCEGYTRAFKYLADIAGIDCLFMQGIATNSDGRTESHAWNCVKLNGTWYLIDTTWDDPIIIGRGVILASTHYKYFLKGTNTFNKDHKLETQFSENGKVFSYPQVSVIDY